MDTEKGASTQDTGLPWVRCGLSTATGFLVTWFLMATFYTYGEVGQQQWSQQGVSWLAKDLWSRQQPWREALLAAALTLLFAVGSESLRRSRFPVVTWIRTINGWCGRATTLVFATALVVLPSVLAKFSRARPHPETPNILLICLDTWRADHASFLGYTRPTHPGLGTLAERGQVFEAAIAQAPWTLPSVATLFTSLVPSLHGARSHQVNRAGRRWVLLGEEMLTLTEVLRDAGFETAAWSRNLNIAPWGGFGSGFESFHVYEGDDGRTEVQVEDVRDWLDGWDGDRPFFLYMHILDPHFPYEAPAPFGGQVDRSDLDFQLTPEIVEGWLAGEVEISPAELQRIVDAYDEELMYVDHHLTPFLKEVMEEHPNTVIILYGDHGDEFLEHGENEIGQPGLLGHGQSLFDELVHVPLVLWVPGMEGQRISTQVRLLDVFPTVMESALLTDGPWQTDHFQGESLYPILKGAESEHRMAPMETGGDGRPPFHYRGMRTGDWKMIRREVDDTNATPYMELYNIANDRGELKDLADEEAKRAGQLFREMEELGWYFENDDPRLPQGLAQPGRLSRAIQGGLAELGYGGGEEDE